jgi:hypothetical protein
MTTKFWAPFISALVGSSISMACSTPRYLDVGKSSGALDGGARSDASEAPASDGPAAAAHDGHDVTHEDGPAVTPSDGRGADVREAGAVIPPDGSATPPRDAAPDRPLPPDGPSCPGTETNACGPSCIACPSVAFADAYCSGGSCAFMCRNGYHRCGDTCRSDADVDACGFGCEVCPTLPNASATCTNGSCGFYCRSSSDRKCDDGCFVCCQSGDCPAADNGFQSECNQHRCENTCRGGIRCNNQCWADQGACYFTYTAPGSCRWGNLCEDPTTWCTGSAESRRVTFPVNDYSGLKSECDGIRASEVATLCSNPDAQARIQAGEKVSIGYALLNFDADGDPTRTFIEDVPCN